MRDWFAISLLAFVTSSVFSAAPVRAADAPPNACGCYHDDKGSCRCVKPTKCGCPGDCEPAGCEAKRQAQAERDNRAALKRIADRERKAAAEAKKQAKQGKRGKTAPAAKPGAGNPAAERSDLDDALEGKAK